MNNEIEIHFAPIQGYTDGEFRRLFHQFFGGIDAFYTPFIRMEDDGSFRRKDLRELNENQLSNLVPQILPGSVDELKRQVDTIGAIGFRRMDINMGCPFPMIVRRHRGCGLLADTAQASSVLKALDEFSEVMFSLKMRLGWESTEESFALREAINAAPLQYVTLHPRLGTQQYKGECHREAFKVFANQCSHPLIYNGDIRTVEDAQNLLDTFPDLRGIMIGRGLLANPMLALQIRQMPLPSSSSIRQFHSALFDTYANRLEGDAHLLIKMKSLWEYFLADADHKALKRIHKAGSLNNYRQAVEQLMAINNCKNA